MPHVEGNIGRLRIELKLQQLYGCDKVTSLESGHGYDYYLGESKVGYWRMDDNIGHGRID